MGDSGSDDDAPPAMSATTGDASVWRYCLHIAYFGTGFVGWQRQNDKSSAGLGSVQELLEEAVTEELRAEKRINVTSVSRTDAGTHALYVRHCGYDDLVDECNVY